MNFLKLKFGESLQLYKEFKRLFLSFGVFKHFHIVTIDLNFYPKKWDRKVAKNLKIYFCVLELFK